jgi:hypothetical protein
MAIKPIRISRHAAFEMRRRGIRRNWVIDAVRRPGQVIPSLKGRKICQSLIGRSGRMLLRVVVKEDTGAIHVITTYRTSKVNKYWVTP